ncbi:MAG TPA: hypothetical protein VFC83_00145 [Erysipelotrichaceae bacterium]|nr:hypothetical protein [Erysipelotrichaceae bacterium]
MEVEKSKARGESVGFLSRKLLLLRVYRILSKVIFEFKKTSANLLFVRNGASYRQKPVIDWCKDNNIKIAYIENGFLPSTIQLDGRGVNCHNSIPRDPDFYMSFKPDKKNSPAKTLVQRTPKIKESGVELVELPDKYYFVPFQVPTDTQVLLNSPWIRSMEEFYEVLDKSIDSLPDGFSFVVKEHPSTSVRLNRLHNKNSKIIFANTHNTQELIERAVAVITLNSTVGVESLLLGRPVITLGSACYNIEGLVSHVDDIKSLKVAISAPDNIKHDDLIVESFIAWLSQKYLIPGKLREFESEKNSCLKVKERIENIVMGGFQ